MIHWIEPARVANAEPAWSVRGINFDPRSTVYFDGLPALRTEFDDIYGELIAVPPHGPPGHRAIVTVYNPDGQSSAFTLPDGSNGQREVTRRSIKNTQMQCKRCISQTAAKARQHDSVSFAHASAIQCLAQSNRNGCG